MSVVIFNLQLKITRKKPLKIFCVIGKDDMKQKIILLILSSFIFACSSQEFGLPDESQQAASIVTYNNKVDLIMMIDNSPSMNPYQGKFAQQVGAMISQFNQLGLDYHISVVTTDMRPGGNGGLMLGTPKFLTAQTPNLLSILQSRISIGDNGSEAERGLESIRKVLEPTYLSGAGAGFLRPDALLAILILTNEDDYSASSVASFERFFDQLKPPFKGTTKAWTLNFIGVLSDTGLCRTTADVKDPGLRYMELADYSGGIKASICDTNLAQATVNLRKRIVEILSEVVLNRVPRIDSIVVTKNGAIVPHSSTNGWEYFSETNSVRFFGTAQPGATDVINVDFTPATGT